MNNLKTIPVTETITRTMAIPTKDATVMQLLQHVIVFPDDAPAVEQELCRRIACKEVADKRPETTWCRLPKPVECKVEGCRRDRYYGGGELCNWHYNALKAFMRRQLSDGEFANRMSWPAKPYRKVCEALVPRVGRCPYGHYKHGLCHGHWDQWEKAARPDWKRA